MRIGIDARFFGSVGKGLGRYTQKLIEKLEEISSENGNEYFIFLGKENFHEYVPKSSNFHKILVDARWYSLIEQMKIPFILLSYKLDLVHFPHFNVPVLYRKKFIVTIHDLILLHFPTLKASSLNFFFYWLKFLAYKFVIGSAIKRAERIITVSNFTKNDILGNYAINPDKLSVTHEACDDFCSVSTESLEKVLRKYGIIKPYLLYVGNAYPHKNLERLIRAFPKLNAPKGLKLVLVGRIDYFYSRLQNIINEEQIKDILLPGFIPDRDLDIVYKNALLYVFPSLYEGFGLPPLEAMAKGLPVVSSDHACMREILGDSAFFFNAGSEGGIAAGINSILKNDSLRSELIRKGYSQIKKYSWERMARETLRIYMGLDGGEK